MQVAYWRVPPPVAYSSPPNTFQDPTKWNGDHVLNGGNKEWAEEDAALHAYNMENWRNQILDTQIQRQTKSMGLMRSLQGMGQAARQPAQGSSLRSDGTLRSSTGPSEVQQEIQQLTGAVKRLSKVVMKQQKNAEDGGSRVVAHEGGARHNDASVNEVLRLENKNAQMLKKVMKKLRAQGTRVFGIKEHEHRLESKDRLIGSLELENRKSMREISRRLDDLAAETKAGGV